MSRGNVFAGTPDQVFAQIKNFWEYAGGFGHLLMMGQAGFLTYAETLTSMRLFTQEVYPRLQELTASCDSERLQAATSRSILTVLPGAGHLSSLERPAEFTTALADFLGANL